MTRVDAKSLLNNRHWSAAYYLAGYAVECGLKACVLVRVAAAPEIVLESRRFSEQCWTHDVLDLVKYAGLEASRQADSATNAMLGKNWLVVANWSETARYERHTHLEAKKHYKAITHKANGVMPWIRAHW